MTEQYALPIRLPAVYAEDNFFVSACNKEAHQWITRWPDWPGNALLLYGPSGSGKTHLAQIWAQKSRGQIIEDIERLADERALLHTWNLSRENKQPLLLTSAPAPRQLPFTLPDLTSRLAAMPSVSIHAPDDEALAGAMRKQFSDCQLKVGDEVIAYLLSRAERSFSHIAALVETIDRAALAEQRNVTVKFIRTIIPFTPREKG